MLNTFKVFETPTNQIVRQDNKAQPQEQNVKIGETAGTLKVECQKCEKNTALQLNLGKKFPLQSGLLPYPKNDILKCPQCGVSASMATEREKK